MSGININYEGAVAVTPSDATTIIGKAIYVGGAGAVAVTTAAGNVVTFSAVPVGTVIPIAFTKIMATNTTATLLLALS
jgi:hypothetical protein